MPLPSSLTQVPLSLGLQTKTSRKDSPPGSMYDLQNAVFTNPGTLQKRDGFQRLKRGIVGGNSVTAGSALATFNDELVLFDGDTAYSYLPSSGWVPKGQLASARATDAEVTANAFSQNAPDCATLGDLQLTCWLDIRGGVRASVSSLSTGNRLINDVVIDSAGLCPRAIAFAGKLYVMWTQGLDLKAQALDPAQPTAFQPVQSVIAGTLDGSGYFDVAVSGQGLAVASILPFFGLNFAFVELFDADFTGGAIQLLLVGSPVGLFIAGDGTVWVAEVSSPSGVPTAFQLDPSDLSVLTTVSFSSFPAGLGSATFADNPTGGTRVFWDQSPGQGFEVSAVYSAPCIPGAQSPALTQWLFGVQLASKSFRRGSQPYLCVQRQSQLQSCLFLVTADTQHRVAGRDLYTGLGFPAVDGVLPQVNRVGPDSFQMATCTGGTLVVEAPQLDGLTTTGQFARINGVNTVTFDFGAETSFFNTQLDGAGYVVGAGGLFLYDGVQFTEQGFFTYPEGVTLAATNPGTGIGPGDYQWIACYAWQDAKGNVSRSGTSVPVSLTLNEAATVIVLVPSLTVTNRPAGTVWVEVYRTQSDGTSFTLVTDPLAPVYVNPASAFTEVVDALTDQQIQATLPLYTAGGAVFDYSPAPPCGFCTTFNDRVWVGGLSDSLVKLAYSNLSVPGSALQFNDTSTLQVDSYGGAITALGVLNQQLIIFKETCIFYVNGPGPAPGPDPSNQAGQPYPNPALIATDVGCTEPNSVVLTPLGLFFKSQKGLYLIGNDNSVTYAGARAERFNSLQVSSAVLHPTRTQVRFTTVKPAVPVAEPGRAIVYDNVADQWTTFTNCDAVDSVIWQGTHVLLKPNGDVWQEAIGTFVDPTGWYPMVLDLNDLLLAGPIGSFRPYEVWLRGTYLGAHSLRCEFQFDGAPWSSQVRQINATSVFSQQKWGGTPRWGSKVASTVGQESAWGGLWRDYVLCFRPYTRCHSLGIRIQDVQPAYPPDGSNPATEAYNLSSVMVKAGTYNRGPYAGDSRKD